MCHPIQPVCWGPRDEAAARPRVAGLTDRRVHTPAALILSQQSEVDLALGADEDLVQEPDEAGSLIGFGRWGSGGTRRPGRLRRRWVGGIADYAGIEGIVTSCFCGCGGRR